MKQIFGKLSMAVAALTMFAACDNSMYEFDQLFPEQYHRVVCIRDAQSGDQTIYTNLPNDTEIPFTILRSGGIPEGEAQTKIVPMTQEELALYEDDGILLSAENYTLVSNLKFESNQRYQNIAAVMTPDQVKGVKAQIEAVKAEDASKDVYLAFKLEQVGDTSVDAMKNYVLRKLSVSEPMLQINLNDHQNVWGSTMSFKVSLPFENTFDIAWDLNVVAVQDADIDNQLATSTYEAWDSLGAATESFKVTNLTEEAVIGLDVKNMQAGTSEVEYTIQIPDSYANGAYKIGIEFGNATIDGGPLITNKSAEGTWTGLVTFQARPGFDKYDYDNGGAPYVALQGLGMTLNPYTFYPESSNPSFEEAQTQLQDGNSGTFWDNNWGAGWGPTGNAFIGAVDFGEPKTISAMEVWRRAGDYVTDLRTCDVYAAKSVDYSNFKNGNGGISYDGLTYLGTMDFAAGDKRATQYMKLKEVTTQYIIVNITRSGRPFCIGIAEMGFFSPAPASEEPEVTE